MDECEGKELRLESEKWVQMHCNVPGERWWGNDEGMLVELERGTETQDLLYRDQRAADDLNVWHM